MMGMTHCTINKEQKSALVALHLHWSLPSLGVLTATLQVNTKLSTFDFVSDERVVSYQNVVEQSS